MRGGEKRPNTALVDPGLAVAGGGGILETYFAQQHHITALISGQTPGHSIEKRS